MDKVCGDMSRTLFDKGKQSSTGAFDARIVMHLDVNIETNVTALKCTYQSALNLTL